MTDGTLHAPKKHIGECLGKKCKAILISVSENQLERRPYLLPLFAPKRQTIAVEIREGDKDEWRLSSAV